MYGNVGNELSLLENVMAVRMVETGIYIADTWLGLLKGVERKSSQEGASQEGAQACIYDVWGGRQECGVNNN